MENKRDINSKGELSDSRNVFENSDDERDVGICDFSFHRYKSAQNS